MTLVFPVITFHLDRLGQRHVRQARAVVSWIGANALGLLSVAKNGQSQAWMRGHVHGTPELRVVGAAELKEHVVCQDDEHKHMTEATWLQAHGNMACVFNTKFSF